MSEQPDNGLQRRKASESRSNSSRKYRGWSSSMAAAMDDPSNRSSMCALVCCGVFLSDRTEQLLDPNYRPNWILRRRVNIFPFVVLLLVNWAMTLTPTDDPVVPLLHLLILAVAGAVILRAAQHRASFRRRIMEKMQETQQQQDAMVGTGGQIEYATGCCCCYHKDDLGVGVRDTLGNIDDLRLTENLADEQVYESGYKFSTSQQLQTPDLSTCLFRGLLAVCCGICCNCWWQCCGTCAVAQQDFEVRRMLAEQDQAALDEALQVDYFTFQKFGDYYPAIQDMERVQATSFVSHCRILSQLSVQILRYFGAILALYAVFYLVQGRIATIFILSGVFAQAGLLLYFVHWRWHRFDLSLDAVIKFTASGFFLGFFMGMVVETTMFLLAMPFLIYTLASEVYEEAEHAGVTPDNFQSDPASMQVILKHHFGIYAFWLFLMSFVVAALTEELCKYFSYWMVETPDQLATGNDKRRQAVQITVAMVAAAIGFAWKENMGYVLQPPRASDELMTLVLRSLTPVHPLCAAIQSIGIVRRDVESDGTFQLGRAILPAILLHGLFDFALFLMALNQITNMDPSKFTATSGDDEYADEGQLQSELRGDEYADEGQLQSELRVLRVGWLFMAGGLAYYWIEEKAQRARLDAAATVEAPLGNTETTVELSNCDSS